MDPKDPGDGRDRPGAPRPSEPSPEARARLDRRAEALRDNLRRRKAQSRGRAGAERAGPPD